MLRKNSLLILLFTLTVTSAEEVAAEDAGAEQVAPLSGGDSERDSTGADGLDAMMDKLKTKGGSEEDQAMMKEMLENLKQEKEKIKKEQEELQQMKQEQQQKTEADGQLAQRHEFQQPPLEKITKRDGTSFYTRIISSDDPPMNMGDWPEGDEPPPPPPSDGAVEGENPESGVAVPSKQGPTTMFTMPAGRDMKEVLKQIMANDGDVRKVPGLRPWKPSDEKRNKNQIGWDDDEFSMTDDDDDVQVDDDSDGTGVATRNGGTATSLADANHQISMLKIDLQTLKQEKTMKEKSASLQISNLKQKLSETRRIMEDLKIASKKDKDDAVDLRRRVEELEERLENSRKSLLSAQSEAAEKSSLEEQLAEMKAESRSSETALKEKEALLEDWQANHGKLEKLVSSMRQEASDKEEEWSVRWAKASKERQSAIDALEESVSDEKKKTKKMTTRAEDAEEELESTKKTLEMTSTNLAEAETKLAAAASELTASKERESTVAEKLKEEKKERERLSKLYDEEHNIRLLLEEAAKVLRWEKDEWDSGKREAALEKARFESEIETLRKQSQQTLPILLGLVGVVTVLLLYNCLRVCCCGGRKEKNAATPVDDSDPDVKSFKSEDALETTTPSKKSKKKEKKHE